MLFVFNKNDKVIEILREEDFFEDEYKQQINGEWIYTFHIDKVNKNIVKDNKIGFFDEDGNFQLFIIDDTEEVFNYSKKYDLLVSCLHDFYDLRFNVIEDKRVVNGSARQALEKCLEGTPYSVGEVSSFDNANINFYYTNSLSGINEIMKTYGGEVYFRLELNESKTAISKKYVDIKYSLGEDTGLRFTFDLNLEEVKKKEHGDIFTVLYGRGSSLESGEGYSRKLDFSTIEWSTPSKPINKPRAQKYVENTEAIKKYGRKEGIFEDNNIKDPEELLKVTYEKLKEYEKHKVTYTVTVEDLSNILGFEHLKVKLGDTIIIIDEEYNILVEARVIEHRYSISKDNKNKLLTLGNFIKGMSDTDNNSNILDRLDKIESKPNDIKDNNFPNTLPPVPTVKAKGGFAVISLEWTYENKAYYTYEIYASKIENFNPTFSNLIFKGQASSFLHEVKPQETWYYRVRAVNSHNKSTPMSNQVSASTFKIADGTEYFESAAIVDALIGTLSLDRGWVGKLVGELIEARNLRATDGNGKTTFLVDSFGKMLIYDCLIEVYNKYGQKVLGLDREGKTLSFTGEFENTLNGLGVSLRRGILEFLSRGETVGGLFSSVKPGTDENGVVLGITKLAEYFRLGFSSSASVTGGSAFNYFLDANNTEKKLRLAGKQMVLSQYVDDNTIKDLFFINHNGDTFSTFGDWNFHNYIMYNLRTATKSINELSRTMIYNTGLSSQEDDEVRYIYKDIKTNSDNKVILSLPKEYRGYKYDIVGIAKKEFGDYRILEKAKDYLVIESERENIFNIEISLQSKTIIKVEESKVRKIDKVGDRE